MKKVTRRVILPASLAALLIIILAVTGHIRPTPPSDQSLLKIIIYTDFECGACARFNSEIEPELRSRYEATGKMQIEIRLLAELSGDPILLEAFRNKEDIHTRTAAEVFDVELGEVTSEQEEDYAVFSIEALTSLAAALDLDEAAFATCLNSEARKAEVEENMNMAQVDGVSTLPAVLVGNFTIQGYKPLDTYVEAIEEALAAQRPK